MGEFLGKELMYRDICAALEAAWERAEQPITDEMRAKLTATSGGESKGFVGAKNDNRNEAGVVWRRDCGFMQNSIEAKYIGTSVEAKLRTESKDPLVYGPVVAYGADLACEKFYSPWTRNGKKGIRAYEPWYAFTQGWVTWNQWWVWARPWLDHWAPTGRYIQKAVAGVANHWLVNLGATQAEALQIARSLQGEFGIQGTLGIDAKRQIVVWTYVPKKPVAPPADGIGPRPQPNSGI